MKNKRNNNHKMTIYHFKKKEKRMKEDMFCKQNKSLADNLQEIKKLKDDLFEYFDTIFKKKEKKND